jgi:hypothetical protein
MTNKKIIEGLTQCHSLLINISNNPFDAFAAANVKETLSNAIRLIGEFETGSDPGTLFGLKRVTIINLYMILKSRPAGQPVGPSCVGKHPVSLDEIIDRIGLFLCVATDTGEFPAVTSLPVYPSSAPAPSGSPETLPRVSAPS